MMLRLLTGFPCFLRIEKGKERVVCRWILVYGKSGGELKAADEIYSRARNPSAQIACHWRGRYRCCMNKARDSIISMI